MVVDQNGGVGLVLLNAAVLLVAIAVLVVSARGRRRSALRADQRAGYVPRAWPRYGIYNWLAATPGRMLGWLISIPIAGLTAGVVLLANRDHFGAVLILASLIGVARTYRPAMAAFRAIRLPGRDDR